jgi:hypothetical protein
MGRPILKIIGTKGDLRLRSGFVIAGSFQKTLGLKAELEKKAEIGNVCCEGNVSKTYSPKLPVSLNTNLW